MTGSPVLGLGRQPEPMLELGRRLATLPGVERCIVHVAVLDRVLMTEHVLTFREPVPRP